MTRSYKIEAGTAQHIGNAPRQNDRVALYAGARAPGYMMAVLADGAQGGAIAADQVLQTSKQLFDEFASGGAASIERLSELLRHIALETHTIIKMSPIVADLAPQSTLVILILTPHGEAVWAHVGDSRLYHFFNSDCFLRSNDAAYVEHLVQQDKVPFEAAKKHRSSRLLSNVLGNTFKEPFIHIGHCRGLQAGHAFLLCSDGLWQLFADNELAAAVARHAPRQGAERLINKAIERARGKGDNCSMAIVKLVAPTPPASPFGVRQKGSV